MAIKFDIPLVIYGEPYAEYGSQARLKRNPSYDLDWYINEESEYISGGLNVDELKHKYGLNSADLEPYLPLRPFRGF